MKLYNICFSARGTTQACASTIASGMNMETVSCNWLEKPCTEPMAIAREDRLLFSMPVYAGYIPKLCAKMVKNLQGDETPAVIAAVYGNRHYDNALLQMKDLLKRQGFHVVAAGAFVAEHSIFTSVAKGRPDDADRKAMADFGTQCARLFGQDSCPEVRVPGDPAYNADIAINLPFKPDADDTCTECGACADICPTHAIEKENIRVTARPELCINCGACMKVCPTGARGYHSGVYEGARAGFEERCAAYRTPETFFPG